MSHEFVSGESKKKRGRLEFLTPRLSEALDRCKISDRNAIHLLIAAAEALGCDASKLILNRTSFQQRRKKFRKQRHTEIRENFKLRDCSALVLHWDGKLLPALAGIETVDRLSILVTSEGKEQLLGVPEIPSSTGEAQATAVHDSVEKWGIEEKIQALCCDTTASNTGRVKGACRKLEILFGRDLLYLPCRHHIFELLLRVCFEALLGATSGPEMTLFKRFREYWPNIDTSNYHDASGEVADDVRQDILEFLDALQDHEAQHREDYRELLELAVIYLGSTPKRGVSFRVPGAVSHARWMAKAIYAFKISLFQDQFELDSRERDAIGRICLFLVQLYVKAWFLSPSATRAPYHDFTFLKQLIKYREFDA